MIRKASNIATGFRADSLKTQLAGHGLQRWRLRKIISGGPIVTVVEITGAQLKCTWRDADGLQREGIFDAMWLEHCEKGEAR